MALPLSTAHFLHVKKGRWGQATADLELVLSDGAAAFPAHRELLVRSSELLREVLRGASSVPECGGSGVQGPSKGRQSMVLQRLASFKAPGTLW